MNKDSAKTLPKGDLKENEVREILGLSKWEFSRFKKEIPRIVYNKRVIRYDLNEVLYWRDGKKQGGWSPEKD